MDARADALRWLEIAEKLLEARDYGAAKTFAERAIDSDPLFDGPDRILAAADVLLDSQRPNSNHYSILQLPPSADLASIRRSYRRFALLLRHPSPPIVDASRLVSEAFSCLSDDSRRRLYDLESSAHLPSPEKPRTPTPPPRVATPPPPPPPPETFWTTCPRCFRAFEYGKEYLGCKLLCQVCRKPFVAAALPSTPPIVPGTDMFYCSWGMFPLGFPGYNTVEIPLDTPSVPAFPYTVAVPAAEAEKAGGSPNRSSARVQAMKDGERRKGLRKVMAKKPPRKRAEVGGGGFDMNAFSMDMDGTSGMFGDLPFLKDDDVDITR